MEQMQAMASRPKPVVRYEHIQIDMETLATTADAVILSIGAVKYNLDGAMDDACFYAVCKVDSQQERRVSDSTLAFWMSQDNSAKDIFGNPDAISLGDALLTLKKFVDRDDYTLWSNGADFDIPMVNHALASYGMEPLVKFYLHRCFRTYKEENKSCPKPPFEGTKHNAIMDAIYQAKWHQAIHYFKRNPPPAKGFAVVKP